MPEYVGGGGGIPPAPRGTSWDDVPEIRSVFRVLLPAGDPQVPVFPPELRGQGIGQVNAQNGRSAAEAVPAGIIVGMAHVSLPLAV